MSVAILLSARRRPRPRLALLLLTLLLIAASLVHLGLGARWIAPQTVLQALLEYDPRNFEQRIIIDLRLVRLAPVSSAAASRTRRRSTMIRWSKLRGLYSSSACSTVCGAIQRAPKPRCTSEAAISSSVSSKSASRGRA